MTNEMDQLPVPISGDRVDLSLRLTNRTMNGRAGVKYDDVILFQSERVALAFAVAWA